MNQHHQIKIPLERFLNLIRKSPPPSIEKIAKLICRDPALTQRVLDLANSAYYGIPKKVTSVHDALKHVGLQTLELMVVVHFDSLSLRGSIRNVTS